MSQQSSGVQDSCSSGLSIDNESTGNIKYHDTNKNIKENLVATSKTVTGDTNIDNSTKNNIDSELCQLVSPDKPDLLKRDAIRRR